MKNSSLESKFSELTIHGIYFGIGSTLKSSLGLLLIPLYTRDFSAVEYGTLSLILITGQILYSIFSFGILAATLRSYYDYKKKADKDAVIFTAITILAVSGLTLLVFSFIFSDVISVLIFGSEEYSFHILLISLIMVISFFSQIPFVVLRAEKKSKQYVFFELCFMIIGALLIILFVRFREWGIIGVLYGQLIMFIISIFVLFFYIRDHIICKVNRREIGIMLRFGAPLIFAGLAGIIFNSIDKYILNMYWPLDVVGVYSLGYQFGYVLLILFVNPLQLIWNPMVFSVKDDANANEFYTKGFTYALFLGSILALTISLLSKEAILIISNPEYHKAYSIVPLVALSYFFWGIPSLVNVGTGLKRKTYFVAICFGIGAALNIIFNFLTIPKYGIMGAAASTLVSYIVMVVLFIYYNNRIFPLSYEWNRVGFIFIGLFLFMAFGIFVTFPDIFISILFKLLLIAGYVCLYYFSNFFSKNEKRVLSLKIRFFLKLVRRKEKGADEAR